MDLNDYTPRKLPDFKGYTVDMRLKEFRKMEYGKVPEFISFDSKKGQRLMKEMTQHNSMSQTLQNNITAVVERVDYFQSSKTAQITMKSHGGKMKLTVPDSAVQNIKAGTEIAIIQNVNGMTIKALKPGIKNSLKR